MNETYKKNQNKRLRYNKKTVIDREMEEIDNIMFIKVFLVNTNL